MINKSVILLLIGIAAMLLIYSLPAYRTWFEAKIWTICNIPDQAQHLGVEERREVRFGYSYVVFRDMSAKLLVNDAKNQVIMLPPDGYLQAMKIADLRTVEPSTFYYFTGLKAVSDRSPGVEEATWVLEAQGMGHLALRRFSGKRELDATISLFRKYK